jgi:uncharacterized protein YwqG
MNADDASRESIRFSLSRHPVEGAVGTTRFGGRPDMPLHAGFPEYDGRLLAFVAQVRLEDLAGSAVAASLPREGLLSFWYEGRGRSWGFRPQDRGSARVLFFGPDVGLAPSYKPFGLPPLRACAATVSSELTLPAVGASPSLAFEGLALPAEDWPAYFELLRRLGHDEQGVHRMGGHPNQIQGDMQLECQLVSNGLYCGDRSGYTDPRADGLRAGMDDWQLLLQVDSDNRLGVMWGDAGRIYFWVRAAESNASRFDDAWVVLQCY